MINSRGLSPTWTRLVDLKFEILYMVKNGFEKSLNLLNVN